MSPSVPCWCDLESKSELKLGLLCYWRACQSLKCWVKGGTKLPPQPLVSLPWRVTSTFSIILFLLCLYRHRMRLKAQSLNLYDLQVMEMRTQLSEYLKMKTQTFLIWFKKIFKPEDSQIDICCLLPWLQNCCCWSLKPL